jgi:hypothetical protein
VHLVAGDVAEGQVPRARMPDRPLGEAEAAGQLLEGDLATDNLAETLVRISAVIRTFLFARWRRRAFPEI